jgi:hypothetical protein
MLFSCLPASTSYGYEIVCCHAGFRTKYLPSGYKLMISDMEGVTYLWAREKPCRLDAVLFVLLWSAFLSITAVPFG